MYLIIGRHSLLLLHCQDFPCKLHQQITFQSPPDLTGQLPQKYHLCRPLSREPGRAEPRFLFRARGPAPGFAPNHGATAPPPHPRLSGLPTGLCPAQLSVVGSFLPDGKARSPSESRTDHVGGGASTGAGLSPVLPLPCVPFSPQTASEHTTPCPHAP